MSDHQLRLGASPANPRPMGLVGSASNGNNISYLVAAEISHVSHLSEHIGSLYLNDDYSDITLVVNGDKFRAHKVILASRSDYFRALLFGGMRETNQSEIELVDTGLNEFKVLLRYIYTGKVSLMNCKEDAVLEILGLAHQYGFSELETAISEYLKLCVEQLVSRDSFCANEIEIFRAVKEWVKVNVQVDKETHNRIVTHVRLSLMKLDDLLNCVRPSGLLDAEVLLDAIKEQNEKRTMDLKFRGFLIPDVNMATPSQGASVLEGELKQALLNGDVETYDMERGFTRHPIDDPRPDVGPDSILVVLGTPCILNHMKLLLWDRDQRAYSYVIDVSIDKTDWFRVIDHSTYLCRSWQQLYFHPKVVKYIRVRGTHNTMNRVFHLVSLEAYYTTNTFTIEQNNGLLIPYENVASVESGACVIEGVSRSRNALLNGEMDHYDWDSGYTCHQLGSGAVVVQLPQPYMIGSMNYGYYIEVSVDQSNWIMVVDKRNEQCKSWQFLRFDPCPVVFIKIVGSHNTANEVFHCVHFETPALMDNCVVESGPKSPPSAQGVPIPGPSWRNNLQGLYDEVGNENAPIASPQEALVVLAQAQIRPFNQHNNMNNIMNANNNQQQ